MENPAMQLLLGSDIGILSVITVGVALLIVVALFIMFYVKSGK
ncbi:MAG: DUF3149 domain-containing protein [Pseudomonadota bacterium]